MEDLRVIDVESGALIAASDGGDRYRIAVDEALQYKLRQSVPDSGTGRKLAPKEIQAHIRSGMSAQDVASITGVALEYIQRFEGPVLAEREYVIESALAVPVHIAADTDPMTQGASFGSVILGRLHDLGAINERWASWKEENAGWVIKLSFTAEQIDHDARWRFDPKKSALAPINNEAITLSQQGELVGGLIPRLRAVGSGDRVADSSRFDSGAFSDHDLSLADTLPHLAVVPHDLGEFEHGSMEATAHPSTDAIAPTHQTADLLEALRRRRGEREAAQLEDLDDAMSDHPSTGSIHLVDVPIAELADESSLVPHDYQPKAAKKGRPAMPSWDEIVFGARSDDDPA